MKSSIIRKLAAALAAATLCAPVLAQDGGPTRIVVPFAAGGPIDVTARVLAEAVQGDLGTVIIENRPGAGGNIGSAVVAKAAPDGKTLGVATLASHAVNPWLYKSMPFDAEKDFEPVTLMVYIPNVLVMNSEKARELNINGVQDLIAYAKANPGVLNYGSGGNGSGGHLAGELFRRQAGVDVVHVPYNGGAPAQLALLSGDVHFTFDNLATAAPNIRAGKLKALAVTTTERSRELPDLPTMQEAGMKNFSISTWWGLVVTAGTPAETVEKLNAAFTKAMKDPKVQERFKGLLVEAVPSTPADFGKLMADERARYKEIVELAGARVD
ncbi:Bug family tripartite tricarboxylate transporter substrate binding protein [Yanghanlia caeni]|uniref:Tripartite tricarboxylate transporter substrate binding protein n=1 Tax=Yanghanlia caeni TaxID=3064283 RepID=A0ABU1D4Z3_9BURK|nr:tripartite tricarboxylate transporter substrate binding protein [Alcaligenaceae bacterium LG-2]